MVSSPSFLQHDADSQGDLARDEKPHIGLSPPPWTPWQFCLDFWDEDVLSIHPLFSWMVGGDLTVPYSNRTVCFISSLLKYNALF